MPHPPPVTPQAAFLAALPRMRAVVRSRLRPLRCPHRRADVEGEAVALCWLWWGRLTRRGRLPHPFAARLADFAALSALSGRRACGGTKTNDVSSPACGRRTGIRLTPLSALTPDGHPLADAVRDNTRTPVPDQVQFRLDFPAWADALPAAKRRVLERLLAGERPGQVAAAVGVSAARVSQVRAELRDDYARFLDPPAEPLPPGGRGG